MSSVSAIVLDKFSSLDNFITATPILHQFHSPLLISKSIIAGKQLLQDIQCEKCTERKQELTFCFVVFKRAFTATKLCVTRLFRPSTEVDKQKVKLSIDHRI